jgi:hypothetical protein
MTAFTDREKAIIKMYGERVPIGGRLAGLAIGIVAFFAPGLTAYMIAKTIRENPEHFPW